jgi:hypothetical protein
VIDRMISHDGVGVTQSLRNFYLIN